MTTVDYKQAYNTALEQLNPQQRAAVEAIEGPLMIVAGPGTGKTQTLALRIAHILQTTHMRPSNILCLTFSVSGAKAMRERLRTFIGADAYAVTVQTIHGFCNDVIQSHPELFEDVFMLEQVDALEQLAIVRQGIKNLPVGSLLRRPRLDGDRASDVLSRITELKRENKRPEDLTKILPVYSEQILYTKNGKPRAESAALEQDKKRVQQFDEFIQVYQYYQTELQTRHTYDFNDMILRCLDVLKANDWLLAPLQERYQYIMIDEFQDLNEAQFAVLSTLTTYVHTDLPPNIACIGDDDQAIYRFQGASVTNMFTFMQRYPSATVVTLTQNYRSTTQILQLASTIISNNTERLEKLVPGIQKAITSTKAGRVPECVHVPNEELQAAYIAEYIHRKHAEGIHLSEIAILCRRNSEVLQLSELLAAANIPCDIQAKRDLLREQSVKEVVAVLEAILNPHDSYLLSTALLSSLFTITPTEHALAWQNWRTANFAAEERNSDSISLASHILTTQAETSIHKAVSAIWQWHNTYTVRTLPELLQSILNTCNVLPQSGVLPANPNTFALYSALFDYVRTIAYAKNTLTLQDLLHIVKQYETEPSLHLEYDIPHLVNDGVQLLTAHAAKGLEYSVVIIPNMWSGNWGKRRSQVSFSLPDALIYNKDEENESLLKEEDERRLFYVACTRAKDELILTVPDVYRSNAELKPAETSLYIAEAASTITENTPPTEKLPPPVTALLQPTLHIDEAFKAFLLERVQNFELSVTALNVFLSEDNGPERFLWEQLLKRPQAKKANLAFGTAVHSALEHFAKATLNGVQPSSEQLLKTFSTHLAHRELLTKEEAEEYLHLGQTILPTYLQKLTAEQPKILFAERQFKTVCDGIPLKGKVDRIDVVNSSNEVRIVDYKTGAVYGTEHAVRKKADLHRQIVFYKLLADSTTAFAYSAVQFRLEFIGNATDKPKAVDLTVSNEEVEDLKKLIKAVWAKIQTLDFTPLN